MIYSFKSLIKTTLLNDHLFTESTNGNAVFGNLIEIGKECGTPNTNKPEYYKEGTIPWANADDLVARELFTTKNHISDCGLKQSRAWMIPKNSLIFSNGASIGNISINRITLATKQGVWA